jgi:hypothetical protein
MSWVMLLWAMKAPATAPDEQGAEEIQQGLDAVSDQGIGAAQNTTGYLPGRKDKVQENARHDDLAPLCCLGLDIAVAHRKKGK